MTTRSVLVLSLALLSSAHLVSGSDEEDELPTDDSGDCYGSLRCVPFEDCSGTDKFMDPWSLSCMTNGTTTFVCCGELPPPVEVQESLTLKEIWARSINSGFGNNHHSSYGNPPSYRPPPPSYNPPNYAPSPYNLASYRPATNYMTTTPYGYSQPSYASPSHSNQAYNAPYPPPPSYTAPYTPPIPPAYNTPSMIAYNPYTYTPPPYTSPQPRPFPQPSPDYGNQYAPPPRQGYRQRSSYPAQFGAPAYAPPPSYDPPMYGPPAYQPPEYSPPAYKPPPYVPPPPPSHPPAVLRMQIAMTYGPADNMTGPLTRFVTIPLVTGSDSFDGDGADGTTFPEETDNRPGGNPSPMENRFAREITTLINEYRSRHNAPALTLDPRSALTARNRATELARGDDLSTSDNENVFIGRERMMPTAAEVVDFWYAEAPFYMWYGREPPASEIPIVAPFTRMVWRESSQIGVGRARGRDGNWVIVALFRPRGNTRLGFARNVLAPRDGAV